MSTFEIELKKYHDVFLSNLMLILKLNQERVIIENYQTFLKKCDLPSNIMLLLNNFDIMKKEVDQSDEDYKMSIYNMTHTKVQDNLVKLKKTSESFLNSIMNCEMTMDGVSGIILKLFTAVSKNFEYLVKKDPKLFQLKTTKENNKQVTMTIIPGLDIIYAWYCYDTTDKDLFWFYLENMFISGTKMIYLVNESNTSTFDMRLLKELNYSKLKKNFFENFPEQNVINIMNLDIDPYLGVGTNQDFGIDDMLESNKNLPNTVSAPGIGSMAKMLGVDKMFNMEELSSQLKKINKSEIDEATNNIKKLLGSNVDENTSDMIGTILSDITEHLKSEDIGSGDPIQNIINIAEKVAQKAIPKIDKNKIDMKKMFESTQNLANNCKDNDGKTMFRGGNNPLSMLTALMGNMGGGAQMNEQDQMKMAQDMMKNLTKQMGNIKKPKN